MSYYSCATEILPGLWLGDTTASNDMKFLRDKQIQFLINCSNDSKFPNDPLIKFKYYLQIFGKCKQNDHMTICHVIDEYCNLIRKNINTYNILVYCQHGNRYSAILIIMYIIKCSMVEPQEIALNLETKRKGICDNTKDYLSMFTYYQKMLKKN